MENSGADPLKIFMSAGEASGDMHGSHLIRAIRKVNPAVRIACLGGPLMESAGADVLVENRDMAVVGALEVLSHARTIWSS
jgi:lipid-A-disaccharide synthase